MNESAVFQDPTVGQKYRYHFDRKHFSAPRSYGEIDLYQIGRLYCHPGSRIGLHPNLTVLELTVVTGGRGTVEINGVPLPVKRGDIHLTFPGDLHSIESDVEAPLEYDFFSFWTKSGDLLSRLEETVQICKSEGISVIRDERISELVGIAIGEINQPDEWSGPMLEGIFRQIAVSVFRDIRKGAGRKALNVAPGDEICYRMMNYIDTHVYSLKNLSELAEALNYNYSYLSDLFHSVTGNTLQEYLRDRKLERAKLLIREGMPLREIAELLQYSSIYTFSRAFRDRYGISPGAYRRVESEVNI